jgi:Glycerophosphoryl diester phosphodiesterase family
MRILSLPARLLIGLALLTLPGLSPGAEPVPLIHAHAHNDYQHKRPLLDALDHGFCSVEADVYLVDGQLLVAHYRLQVKSERTLQALYLDPLRERVKKNDGHVYPAGQEFTLLVELKSDWQTSYPVLRDLLKQYAGMLTSFRARATQTNAIRVIITGHRAKEMFSDEAIRYASMDGDLADLDSGEPATLIPWISGNWAQSFKWRGSGTIPDADKLKLKSIVAKAHQQGRRVRFWGAPDQPVFWGEMLASGVDLINTDDLDGAQKFLLKN